MKLLDIDMTHYKEKIYRIVISFAFTRYSVKYHNLAKTITKFPLSTMISISNYCRQIYCSRPENCTTRTLFLSTGFVLLPFIHLWSTCHHTQAGRVEVRPAVLLYRSLKTKVIQLCTKTIKCSIACCK